jgi:gas vesicle protein
MENKNDDVNVNIQSDGPLPAFAWLMAGIGIGAVAGILLAPRSGEDTREWISTQSKNGMDTVNSKVRQTGRQVGDWIDESRQRVLDAVGAGQDAFSKAKSETS